MRPILPAIAGMTLSTLITGCMSIDGYRVIETDGHVRRTRVGGLPVVIQRPKHAVFVVTQTTYKLERVTVDENGASTFTEAGEAVEVSISDEPMLFGPSEVYAVDFKRPASGTIDYSMELANYYPTKLGAKLEDKTIGELRQLANDLATTIIPGLTGVQKESGGTLIRTQKSVEILLLTFDLETGVIEVTEI